MPVEINRVERGVYHVALSEKIQLEEIFEAQASGHAQAQAEGDTAYVQIISVHPSTDMPFDIRRTGDVIKGNAASATFVVGATLHIRFLVGILGSLFGLGKVEYAKTFAEALTAARKRYTELSQ